jgi:transposase-like protein
MTDYSAAIPLLAIPQLRCPKCHSRMNLVRTSPGPTGFELRTFDCAKCDQSNLSYPGNTLRTRAVLNVLALWKVCY